MRKLEFALGITIRFFIFMWALTSLIEAGDWGWIWESIGHFCLAIVMLVSIVNQGVMLYKWNPQEKQYYQF